MKIAVLGWGSLIWNPSTLNISGNWSENGPELPIEFARVSNNGRLTLVIKTGAKTVQVLWTLMETDNLEDARKNLQIREKATSIDRIGFVNLVDNTDSSRYNGISEVITKWAKLNQLEGVIWTDLGVKFKDKLKKDFNAINVIDYLINLPRDKKLLAQEYIMNTPLQIMTEIREEIEYELGWKK